MRIALMIVALAAGCKPSKPMVAAETAPAEPNAAVKYVGNLQADVKLAQEAKEKAEAANKKAEEAQKAYKEAEAP